MPVNILQQWGWPELPLTGDGNIQLTASGDIQANVPLKPTVSGQLHAVNAAKQQVTQTMNAGIVSSGEVTSTGRCGKHQSRRVRLRRTRHSINRLQRNCQRIPLRLHHQPCSLSACEPSCRPFTFTTLRRHSVQFFASPAPVTVIVLPVRAAFKVRSPIRQQRALHRRLHARLAD